MNPLREDFEYVPFTKIKNEHYLPAIEAAIKEAKDEINQIKKKPSSFENTIVGLDHSNVKVERIAEIFSNMLSAETNDELQEISKKFMPLLTNYSTDILQDQDLFTQVESVYSQIDDFLGEDRMLLEKTYKSFVRGGATLKEKQKKRVRQIDEELSVISLQFGENVLKETNEYYLLVENPKDLAGIPERSVEAAKKKAGDKGHDLGWAFTLDIPSFLPFLTYCQNRFLREELYKAFAIRCTQDSKTSNKENIKRLIRLRQERAKILGYATHAHYILSERMAQNPETVDKFLEDLRVQAMKKAILEIDELKEYAKKCDGLENFSSWDHYYYFEKFKKEKFDFDDEILRPYFALDRVLNGVFTVAKRLYGIQFKEVTSIPVYHQDVTTYEVSDQDGSFLGILYTDFFPRSGKRNGAWMTEYRKQAEGARIRPHVAIVCNFTPPSKEAPSLLSFMEARTLFHEFGHALHGLLSQCHYSSLSGPNVYWDFVELPSQIMENWIYEPECLNIFAKHWQTDHLIDAQLVEKIKLSSNFFEAVQTVRQLGFGLLDMAWHTCSIHEMGNVVDFEQEIMKKVALLPLVVGACMSCSFGHIFNGGYSAGYYSYKWAEVLDADAFELFLEKGIFNQEVGSSFRTNILSRGGSEHPMELYKKFRGRAPHNEALLRRSGIQS